MKVTYNELTIEATAEELRSCRTLADNFNYALSRIFDRITPEQCESTEETSEEKTE